MLLPGVAGDCVRVSFGCCAGCTTNRRGGRSAAKAASSRSGPRGFLAEDAEKLFAGSERYLVVPAAFLVVGHFRHDSYAEHTALLAGEAYADSAIVDIVMKMSTRRLRPSDIAPNGNFSDTFFSSHKNFSGTSTSFPSGHAASAFPGLRRRRTSHRMCFWGPHWDSRFPNLPC